MRASTRTRPTPRDEGAWRCSQRLHRGGVLLCASLALGLLGYAMAADPHPRLIWNASGSVPIGLYFLVPDQRPQSGELVVIRLPESARRIAVERGYLPAHIPLIKWVAAAAGDTVCGDAASVSIDGQSAAHRLAADRLGRPLPDWTGCRTLAVDEVFLLGDGGPASFDGRYFGPVDARQVIAIAVPVLTFAP